MGSSSPRERVSTPADPVIFLHVSFMNLIKGIPYLLDAWRDFRSRSTQPARLWLAGSMDRQIQRLLETRYRALPDLVVHGYVPDLSSVYTGADVFLSPSVADAGPTTILEAMATGLPVIASRNCGFSTLIQEGENGFTYAYQDTARLSELMSVCVEDRRKLARMGEKARSLLPASSLADYADEIIQHMTGRRHSSPPAGEETP